MDADTLIIYVLAFVFFVLPSILRRLGKQAGPGKNKASLLPGKLGDKVRNAFQELARQAQVARTDAGRAEGDGIWDILDDRDETTVQTPAADSCDDDSQKLSTDSLSGPYDSAKEGRPQPVQTKPPSALSEPVTSAMPVRAVLPPHALQQAMVWKEILGPPKGLEE
jgi:hypothetical protein